MIGGAVESVLGFPLQEEDVQLLITFLHDQEKRGYFFSSALGYSHETDNTGKVIYKKKIHDYSLFPLSDHNPERQHCQRQVSFADGGATLDSAAVLGKIANNGKRHILSKLIFDNLF